MVYRANRLVEKIICIYLDMQISFPANMCISKMTHWQEFIADILMEQYFVTPISLGWKVYMYVCQRDMLRLLTAQRAKRCYLGDAQDNVYGGGQWVDGAHQFTSHHPGKGQRHRLAQHHSLWLDSPDTWQKKAACINIRGVQHWRKSGGVFASAVCCWLERK